MAFWKSRVFRTSMLALTLGMGCMMTSCDNDAPTLMYDTQNIAPSLADKSQSAVMDYLGPTMIDGGVQFAVYSENATRIEVLLFDNPESSTPTMRFPLVKQGKTNVWTIFIHGIGEGQHYGYIAWGPNWPYDESFEPGSTRGFKSDCDANGNRFNPNKLLIDPYAKRIHRDFDWGSGNPASGTARDVSTWKAAAKSVVIQSKYEWSANETEWRKKRQSGNHPGHGPGDAIYYEVQPHGFTKKAIELADLGIKVTAPGTWRGIGEMAPYLKDLGITALELMPTAEKPDDGTYWGYNTINFFAPEQRFAVENKKELHSVIDEFKWMVDQLHQNDIEVILDVVYNHTGEGGFWRSKVQQNDFDYGAQANFDDMTAATIYSFRGLDNQAYYHLTDDPQMGPKSGYLDQTGVGNQTRTNYVPFKRLILDNLRYWVEEMHVDGFRFDLASVLGVADNDPNFGIEGWFPNVSNTVLQDIVNDATLQKYNTRLIAEPWHLGYYAIGGFPKSTNKENYGWSEWNGRFRDMFRRFVNYDVYPLSSKDTVPPYWSPDLDMGNLLTGTSTMFGDDGRGPHNSVNFITAHDGFTMYDLVTYEKKQNKCGKLNPICCNDTYNAFCDYESGEDHNESRNWCATDWQGYQPGSDGVCENADHEALKRQMIRNFFALMMFSQGSPMILGGDEWMRTQYGNNNAYSDSSNNEFNWFRWGDWVQNNNNQRMRDFVRKAIKIRKQFSEYLAPTNYDNNTNLQWHGPDGMSESFWDGKAVGMYYAKKEGSSTPELFIAINMEAYDKRTFYLPGGGEWKILLDTQNYYDYQFINDNPDQPQNVSHNVWIDGSNVTSLPTYEVQPRSIVVFSK
ncbi:MAG: glycosyl hydrolase [Proteobacteria bacterium]|nr:glycosyl hydrolase [Pseudomonadota bacterium]